MHKNSQNISIGRGEREAFAWLRSQRLSVEEKNMMKKALQMSMSQARTAVLRPERRTVGLFSFFLGRPFAVSALSLVLVIGSSLGVARAAEQALPGEPLYSVKIKVNEPLIASFKYSDTARREWEHERVERRMVEAETLAQEGKLGENEKNEIEQQLSERRKTLEQIEGRDIDDDEFIPQQAGDKAKKTQVRFEHQENGVRVHIEEWDSDANGNENGESRSLDESGEDFRQGDGASFEEGADEGTSQKIKSTENESRSQTEVDKQKTSDQKKVRESDKKSSLSGENSSSGEGGQESGQSDAEQDGENSGSNDSQRN